MDWFEMLPELLVRIAQKHILFYEDYHSFAGVWKSWHSAAVEVATKVRKSNGLPSRFPSLLLAERTGDDEFREVFLLSNETARKIRLPEAYGKFCTSSRGWLATEGDDYAVKLVHPLSRETINLPSIDTLPDICLKAKGIWKLLVPSLEIVVVVWGNFGKLGFCRPGDNKWTPVLNGWCGQIQAMTYYNNRVYTFNGNRNIQTCDIYGDGPTIMIKVAILSWDLYSGKAWLGVYILGLDDDEGRKRLLVIIKETNWGDDDDDDDIDSYRVIYGDRADDYRVDGDDDDRVDVDDGGDGDGDDDDRVDVGGGGGGDGDGDFDHNMFICVDVDEAESEPTSYMTEGFVVFGYDLETETWSKVTDLGRKTLFVGHSSSFWIEDTTGVIKGNCIYYTDDNGGRGRDIGIYHMSDGTIEPHYGGESVSKLTPPIWLQSI